MKRVVVFLMCLIMVAHMTACGNGEGTVDKDEKPSVSNGTSVVSEKAEIEDNSTEESSEIQGENSDWVYYYQLTDTRKDNEPERRYEYDEQGRVLKLYDGSAVIDYEYDEEGRLIKETYSSRKSGKVNSYFLYEYNEYDELIKKSECKPSGTVETYIEYGYGNDGIRIESHYTGEGVLFFDYLYTYEDGKLSRKTFFKTSTTGETWEESYVNYEYDDVGNLVKEMEYAVAGVGEGSDGYMFSKIFEYDSEGRLAKSYTSYAMDNDKPVLDWEKRYDDYDNLIQEIYYMKSGDVSYIRDYIYQEVKVTKLR